LSGRVTPNATLAAATFIAAGHTCAARAGRPALAVASALATTVWAYDLRLKHTAAGRASMAAARGLDLPLGATATTTARRRHTGTAGSEEPSPGTRTAATR
jgi:4-hydroxybenzoate polyprenyltransferase